MKNTLVLLFLGLFFQMTGQWSSTNLTTGRVQIGSISYGSKAYFGGGSGQGIRDDVEIYDGATGDWTYSQLSVPRAYSTAVANGGKVFFAGGVNWNLSSTHYSIVDILDTLTMQWSEAELSFPRMNVQAAAVGDKVLFAGGFFPPLTSVFTDVVDIYELSTDTWTSQTLSVARAAMAVAVVGDIVVFAGGQNGAASVTDQVDIYDSANDSWTTATLSQARAYPAATAIGSKIYIAGGVAAGNQSSDRVDILDMTTGQWTTSQISVPRCFNTQGATACGKAFFAGGGDFNLNTFQFTTSLNTLDIYDPATNTWTAEEMPKAVVNHSLVALNNTILIAGGGEFPGTLHSSVDIYSCETTNATKENSKSNHSMIVAPNPASDFLRFSIEQNGIDPVVVTFTNMTGQTVHTEKIISREMDIGQMHPGFYIVKVQTGMYTEVQKILKL